VAVLKKPAPRAGFVVLRAAVNVVPAAT